MNSSQPASERLHTTHNLSNICPVSTSIAAANISTPQTVSNSFSDSLSTTEATNGKQVTIEHIPQPTPNKDFMESNKNEKKATNDLNDVCLPIITNKEDTKEDVCPDLNKKRKTTAGDLVKDLETEPEAHDVISAGCSLDVLSTADVGELELDDDELLGNFSLNMKLVSSY